jgi:hypothetical protein
MRYLLVIAALLSFLVLWSRLPDATEPQTYDAQQPPRPRQQRHAEPKGRDETGVKLHRDQIGEPDEHGRIRIGVNNWLGPDPAVPGYVSARIDLDHVAHPPRVVTYEPQQISRFAAPAH